MNAGILAWSLVLVIYGILGKPIPLYFGVVGTMALALLADWLVPRVGGWK